MYYTYMLRCADDSIYTGITTDWERRMKEHFSHNKKCAKYTLSHNAIRLEAVWESDNRALASKMEYHIKRLSKQQKERLISENAIEILLGDKVEAGRYQRIGEGL